MQWGAEPITLGWCLGRESRLPALLLPKEALVLSSVKLLDAAGFNLLGTAELFLPGLPIKRTE